MTTITATLEADADGTLHLPVPQNLRRGKVRVVATLETESEIALPGNGATPGTPLEALKELRKLGGLRRLIPDPVAWQREQRKERPLPGRDWAMLLELVTRNEEDFKHIPGLRIVNPFAANELK